MSARRGRSVAKRQSERVEVYQEGAAWRVRIVRNRSAAFPTGGVAHTMPETYPTKEAAQEAAERLTGL